MAQILYGVVEVQPSKNETDLRFDTLGKNSEVIAVGDPLTIASGVLKVAGTTDSITGVAAQAGTMPSSNSTVFPPYIPIQGDTVYLMGTNADLTDNKTDGGTYYKLSTATSGVVQVDVTSGVQTTTARVVEIIKVDPFLIGGSGSGSGLRQCYVRFVKTPYIGVPTSS